MLRRALDRGLEASFAGPTLMPEQPGLDHDPRRALRRCPQPTPSARSGAWPTP
jgi:hypothetical protein